ncbi:MAG: HAD-IIB family hydrolase [Pseudomonadota bacterium]
MLDPASRVAPTDPEPPQRDLPHAIHTLIFTDLDQTLLDDRYDLVSAAGAMDSLYAQGVVVIPVSSKTLPELEALAEQREQRTPLIFENGAGIAWPLELAPTSLSTFTHNQAIETEGLDYRSLCALLNRLRAEVGFRFRGFSDMSATEVAERTRLSVSAARLAKDRYCSEPLIWQDTPQQLARFCKIAAQEGLRLQNGGRFVHVMPATDKGQAAAKVYAAYRKTQPQALCTLACGDSPNDQALLEYAQACALFPRPDGSYLDIANKPIVCADRAGTTGWLDAVDELLKVTRA